MNLTEQCETARAFVIAPMNNDDPGPGDGSDNAAKTPAVELPNELPKGLMESFDLLRQVDSRPAKTRQEHQQKEADLKRLKKHIFDMQQGLPTLHDSQVKGHFHAVERLATGHKRRIDRIAAIQAFLNTPPVLPQSRGLTLGDDPKAVLLDDAELQRLTIEPRAVQLLAEALELMSYPLCYPRSRIEEINHELPNADLDEIRRLKSELQELHSPASEQVAASARLQVENHFQPAFELQRPLLARAIARATELRDQARAEEKAFFARFNLPWKATPLSLRFDALLSEVSKLTPRKNLLAWFGVPDMA